MTTHSTFSGLLAQFGTTGIQPVSTLTPAGEDPLNTLEQLISIGLAGLTTVAGIFFIIYFLTAAFDWVTSGGDKGKLETAKGKMTNGVLGLVIIITAYTIIGLIGSVLGLRLLEPAEVIRSILP